MGKPIGWPPPLQRDADSSLREFAKAWFATVQHLLDQGKLKPHPLRLMSGGVGGPEYTEEETGFRPEARVLSRLIALTYGRTIRSLVARNLGLLKPR
jgi:hypothetical protein